MNNEQDIDTLLEFTLLLFGITRDSIIQGDDRMKFLLMDATPDEIYSEYYFSREDGLTNKPSLEDAIVKENEEPEEE